MAEDPILHRSDAALARRTLRGVLIIGPGVDEPMLITSPGDIVWDVLEEPCSRPDLIASLVDAFGEDAATIAADIEPVLAQLIDAGALIETPS